VLGDIRTSAISGDDAVYRTVTMPTNSKYAGSVLPASALPVWRDGVSDPSRDGEADPVEDGQADPTGDGEADPVTTT
jgi:hypothetical protein